MLIYRPVKHHTGVVVANHNNVPILNAQINYFHFDNELTYFSSLLKKTENYKKTSTSNDLI
jgi:hypothetical protein